ncbi:aromatic ring-hydroxylating oxygenase subunit alpha [Pseudomonas typographi]|uniref:aromatic ring-hydroxylating oxygenase subunit alpha n=1 Tax=Pseudomonas typographi TaxID=2715964 RepID=UPI00168782FB|nr:aromatic ring-hydroxylating dioxygenase subunit alpha [Pseudomonas typographi]MBD1552689.1 aromatic ring-hydroxylating dioxygenase subunit alpha [Pseudomonas typographi]
MNLIAVSAQQPLTAGDGCQDPVLLNDWHVIGYADDFAEGTIYPVRLLERELIAWRSSDGQVHVWEDLCIHRGARLSKGWIKDDKVVCPYHGWQYNGEGGCTLMPAAPDETPMKKARAFPYAAVQRYGFVWVCLGTPASDIPQFPEWEDERFMKVHSGPYPYAANGFRAVENFIDASHFPFVHAGLNGVMDNPDRLEPYTVEETDTGLKSSEVRVFQPWGDARGQPLVAFYTYHTFRPLVGYFSKRTQAADAQGLPVTDHSDTFTTLFTVQPLDATHSIVRVLAALDVNPRPTAEAVRERADVVFAQDRDIVESQRPERIPVELRYELHHRTDLMGQRYRTWLRNKGITYGVI